MNSCDRSSIVSATTSTMVRVAHETFDRVSSAVLVSNRAL